MGKSKMDCQNSKTDFDSHHSQLNPIQTIPVYHDILK